MAKRLIFMLWMLLLATQAVATPVQPPDVAAAPTTPVAVTFKSGTSLNVLGNGTATDPDNPPYFSVMPADIPTADRSSLLEVTDGTASYETCDNPAVSCEAKFRLHSGESHGAQDDPVVAYGQPGFGHLHDFTGNLHTNAYSTYTSLRQRSDGSLATGFGLNGTAYWFPGMIVKNPFGDGKDYMVRISIDGIYYLADNSVSPWLTPLPPGLMYVMGRNASDPENTTRQREVIVANHNSALAGNPNRYEYRGDGFDGYQCFIDADGNPANGLEHTLTGSETFNGSDLVPYLNSTDGQNTSDPFLGNCKMNTITGLHAIINAQLFGPDCWNGVNPWVAGGMDHMRLSVGDNQLNAARIQHACPDHWYHIPSLEQKVQYDTTGWADYSRWRLSSDDMFEDKLNSLPTCTTDSIGAFANAPCATRSGPLWNSSLGRYKVPSGFSYHGDWRMGWDGLTLKLWEGHCLGIQGLYDGDGNILSTAGSPIDSTPHTCEPGVIIPNGTSTTFMKNISITTTHPTTSPSTMFQIPSSTPTGTHTYHSH